MAIFLVIASGSRSAIGIGMVVLLDHFIIKGKKHRLMNYFFGVTLIIISLLFINEIAAKPEGIGLFGARYDNLVSLIKNSSDLDLFLGNGWGAGSSWHRVLSGNQSSIPPLDSMFGSLLYQVGVLGLLFFYLWLIYTLKMIRTYGIFLFVFTVLSLQINFLEYYPVINILFLIVGILIGKNQIEKDA